MKPSLAERLQRAIQAAISSNNRNDEACFGLAQEELKRLLEQVDTLEKQAAEKPQTPS